jgi:type IV pilus assembly protein PilV
VTTNSVTTSRATLRRQRGYTVVELLMALAVFAVGVSGIISMQKVTVAANGDARHLALATHIAQSWLDELAAEAGQWNDTDDFDDTDWLSQAGAEDGPAGSWFRPAYDDDRQFGPAFDALGGAVAPADIPDAAQFCTDLRFRWLAGQTAVKRGGGLLRAEVRVFWRRYNVVGLAAAAPTDVCDIDPAEFDAADGRRLFHVVYLSTALRQYMGTPE